MTTEKRLIDFEELQKAITKILVDAIEVLLVMRYATRDAMEVVHERWEWFEEWNPSTPDHPRECDDCGWRCSRCKTALADAVGVYWDNYFEEPKINYCPNCGAKMDGGNEDGR